MHQGIIIRKCWSCHKNLLNTEQMNNDKPCKECQAKGVGVRIKDRHKKVIHTTSYEDIKSRLCNERSTNNSKQIDNVKL